MLILFSNKTGLNSCCRLLIMWCHEQKRPNKIVEMRVLNSEGIQDENIDPKGR